MDRFGIMFVCHGNICRSTMAEFVMRDMLEQAGLEDKVAVASSATSTEEIGNPVHHGTRRMLERHGISCDGKRAVQLKRSDYDRYDLFVGMDGANIRNMRRMLGGDAQKRILPRYAVPRHDALYAVFLIRNDCHGLEAAPVYAA